jgi:hypothetical protein
VRSGYWVGLKLDWTNVLANKIFLKCLQITSWRSTLIVLWLDYFDTFSLAANLASVWLFITCVSSYHWMSSMSFFMDLCKERCIWRANQNQGSLIKGKVVIVIADLRNHCIVKKLSQKPKFLSESTWMILHLARSLKQAPGLEAWVMHRPSLPYANC